MSEISIYTDVDTLFDTRRGIIEHVMRDNGHPTAWNEFKEIYQNRKLDLFDKPELGITQSQYEERFAARSVNDWVDEQNCYFYPTQVVSSMLPIVRSIEFNGCAVINTSAIKLTINTYPFILSDVLAESLRQHIAAAFKIGIQIEIVTVPFAEQTAPYINAFNYVFRYGHLISKELVEWHKTYENTKLMGAKIIVPDLLAKLPSDDPVLAPLNNESVKSIISKISILQGGRCIFIPFDKGLFDYLG